MQSIKSGGMPPKPYRLKSAMQALADETGVKKESLLKENRGPIERFRLRGNLAKKLGVKKKDLQVPVTGPISLTGKALSKVSDHAAKALLASVGSHLDLLAVNLMGGPVALEQTLNSEPRKAAETALQGSRANMGPGQEHPTQTWARCSDGWNTL